MVMIVWLLKMPKTYSDSGIIMDNYFNAILELNSNKISLDLLLYDCTGSTDCDVSHSTFQ